MIFLVLLDVLLLSFLSYYNQYSILNSGFIHVFPFSLYLLKAESNHCMTVSVVIIVYFPVNLLHFLCCLTLCASLFFSSFALSLLPPTAAGLLIVLRLSIDKDIDRYHWPENMRLLL